MPRCLFGAGTGSTKTWHARLETALGLIIPGLDSPAKKRPCDEIKRCPQSSKGGRDTLRTMGYDRRISLAFNHETEEVARIQRTVQKKVLMTRITTMGWSFTYSQTFWNVKSSEP